MNKNIEKKISKENYGSCTEISRCKVKNFSNKFYITETMSCKSKARKKSVNRSDHKHNYVDAVIMYKVGKDDSHFYLGKVCSTCGRIDAKYTYRIDNNSLFKEKHLMKWYENAVFFIFLHAVTKQPV